MKAERDGGSERRGAIESVIRFARKLGCAPLVSDSKEGGFKLRYGSIRYAVLDVNTQGRVYFHVKAHPNKDLPDNLQDRANDFIAALEGVDIKNGPINCYGQVEAPIESIPMSSLEEFLNYSIKTIKDTYYRR
jgi:hypothetical protein